MKMIPQTDARSLGELTPVAIIHASEESFRHKGIMFQPASDDWGDHHIAAFKTEGVGTFAVVHYDHDPKEITHLFVSGDIAVADVARLVAKVASELDVPPEAFQWRDQNGELVSLAPRKAA